MVVVDFTIVQVALPSIGREFGVSVNVLQWIITAYGLTLAGFLMLSGRVGDIYGHKNLFIIGVLLFSLASLTGGLAPSDTVLILARVVQGLGAAMASATGLSILVAAFHEGKERNRALSIFSAATGSGFAAGMIFGGLITATLGWRWVFDINVPIGIIVSLLSAKYISSNNTGLTHENKQQHQHGVFALVSNNRRYSMGTSNFFLHGLGLSPRKYLAFMDECAHAPIYIFDRNIFIHPVLIIYVDMVCP